MIILPGVRERERAGVERGVDRGVECADSNAGRLNCRLKVCGSPGAGKKT